MNFQQTKCTKTKTICNCSAYSIHRLSVLALSSGFWVQHAGFKVLLKTCLSYDDQVGSRLINSDGRQHENRLI